MHTRSSNSKLIPLDLELEKTLRDLKKSKMAGHDPMLEMMRQMKDQMDQIKAAQDASAAKEAAEKAKVPLGHEYLPPTKNFTNGGWGTIVANNFELKPGFVAMIQQRQFGGRDNEDPNKHLSRYLELCDTIKQAGVTTDAIRLRTFGFSLRDEATEWFESLDREEIPDWETMCKIFLAEYYPPAKAQKQVSEILSFSQFAEETFSEAWKRFLAMMRKCPQHGLTKSQQLIRFYNGLTPTARDKLDGAAGGSLLNLAEEDARKVVETMAATGAQWPSERQIVKKLASVATDTKYDDLLDKYNNLQREFDAERKGKMEASAVDSLPLLEDANFIQGGKYRQGYNQGGYGFNNNRNHPNFSYANPNNALQPPAGFNVRDGVIQEPKKITVDDLAQQIEGQNQKFSTLEQSLTTLTNATTASLTALTKQLKMMETQIGQLAISQTEVHNPGKFPSNTAQNPKDHRQVNAIQLRKWSGICELPRKRRSSRRCRRNGG